MDNLILSLGTSTTRKARALVQFDLLEARFEENSSGGPYSGILQELQQVGRNLKHLSPIAVEKTDSFLSWAEILYSARKHHRWSSPYQGGAAAVAHFMRVNLVSLKECINRIPD
jgi:hypothetical protein